MKRIEVFISECDGDRRIGTLEYYELRGKEVSSFELDAGVPIESVDTLLDGAEYFRLGKEEAIEELERIRSVVSQWRDVAVRLGIPRREQEEMSVCFTKH